MAKRLFQLIMACGILSCLLCLPAKAQDVAFDAPAAHTAGTSVAPHNQSVQQRNLQPISTSAASENHSNLKHWSRFSNSSAKPLFVRVPAGTKTKATVSRYVRPQWIEPGKACQPANQCQKGPVKRYLAYNVPAGSFTRKQTPQAAALPSSSARKPVFAKAQQPAVVHVLGYGKRSGEVTRTAVPAAAHRARTYISCYSRYQ